MNKHTVAMLLKIPIAFHRVFVELTGSISAALMLSQAFYWCERGGNKEGWIYKTASEWTTETGLTRREQETARKVLKQLPFWREQVRKANGTPTVHYRIDMDVLYDSIWRICENGNGGFVKIQMAENAISITETTTENTSEISTEKNSVLIEHELQSQREPLLVHEPAGNYNTLNAIEQRVVSAFEHRFGAIKKRVLYELSTLLDTYTETDVIYAINEAADRNKPTMGYIKGVLRNKQPKPARQTTRAMIVDNDWFMPGWEE